MPLTKWSSLVAACGIVGVGAVVACGFDEPTFAVENPSEEFVATLNGANEVPPVTTTATGEAVFAVIDDSIIAYNVGVTSADSVTAAHIHEGGTGTPGAILVTLFTGASSCKQNAGSALTITSSSVGNPTTITLAAAHGRAVGSQSLFRIAGHTGSTPSLDGEHTVTATGAATFTVPVNVATGGTGGTAQRFTLVNGTSPRCRQGYTGALSQIQLRYHALPSDTLTHRQYTSYGATARARFDSLLVRMRNGSVYVNVHTRTNPSGEVRGQINPR